MTDQQLYHYTCNHSVKGIRRAGKLDPNPNPALGGMALIWLTDMDVPDIAALGLTSHILKCRRTQVRVTVDAAEAVHWPTLAHHLRQSGHRDGVEALESAPAVLPMHWWVSLRPVEVVTVEALS